MNSSGYCVARLNSGITENGGFLCTMTRSSSSNYAILFRVAGDTNPPNTKINQKLDGNLQPIANNGSTSSTKAMFNFYGIDDLTPSSKQVFECRLDSNLESAFSQCAARPMSYANLSEGEHTFEVRAVDKAGNKDGTPAKFTWTIVIP